VKACGPVGEPGDDLEILRVSKLVIAVAENFLEWEEDIRFSSIPGEFSAIQDVVQGVCGTQLGEILRIPQELSNIFERENPGGYYKIEIVLKLPDNFERDVAIAMEESRAMLRRKRA
jgi:hypothetical protein